MTNYTDVKIDTNGEFVIVNNDLVTVTGNDETLQRVIINLKVFLGEWFLTPDDGFDFFGKVGGQRESSKTPRQEIERVILSTEGIKNISTYSETINRTTGQWSFTIGIVFDDGQETEVNI